MKYNYHTHTARCMHAVGTDEQYVIAAIAAGFDEIGFSDHCPWNFPDYVSTMRMHENQLDEYVASIRALREKYKEKISIKIGFECEFYQPLMPWLEKKVRENKLDYLILGHHFNYPEHTSPYYGFTSDPKEVMNYANEIEKAVKTGLFSYIAHPDLFMREYPVFDETCEKASRKIIQAAIDCDIALEYNLLGLRNQFAFSTQSYPYRGFWELVSEMGAKAVIGLDVHDPDHFSSDYLYDFAYEILDELKIEIVKEVKMLKY